MSRPRARTGRLRCFHFRRGGRRRLLDLNRGLGRTLTKEKPSMPIVTKNPRGHHRVDRIAALERFHKIRAAVGRSPQSW
ncbi:MAG: hypothetical protein IPF92_31190 [Myxococcales bacterium]|nr:hypothetical protein [Myxococcales bacterium]